MRFFNTAGPNDPARHYCLPLLERFDLDEVMMLIAQQKYFVLHAPRQTGKTTSLLALRDYLNAGDDYRCVYVNVEMGQTAREDVDRGIRAVLGELAVQMQHTLGDRTLEQGGRELLAQRGGDSVLNAALTCWAQTGSRPLVLLGDFTETEVYSLYEQHSWDTGQHFEQAALSRLWHLTQGQPWLSNACDGV